MSICTRKIKGFGKFSGFIEYFLENFNNIEIIDLKFNNIISEFNLVNNKNLNEINLFGNPISDEVLKKMNERDGIEFSLIFSTN